MTLVISFDTTKPIRILTLIGGYVVLKKTYKAIKATHKLVVVPFGEGARKAVVKVVADEVNNFLFPEDAPKKSEDTDVFFELNFKDAERAEKVLDELRKQVRARYAVTVWDYYDAAGFTPPKRTRKMDNWGWTERLLRDAKVHENHAGFFQIAFPEPIKAFVGSDI